MRNTLKSDWYFILPATVVWAAGLAVIAWDFVSRQNARFRRPAISLAGLTMMIFGVGMRLVARRTLGGGFTYALQTTGDQALITHGIYHRIRHPGYTGDLIFHFGVALFFESWRGLLVLLGLIPCFLYRMRIEERMLAGRFGEAYLDYSRSTKRLLPFLY